MSVLRFCGIVFAVLGATSAARVAFADQWTPEHSGWDMWEPGWMQRDVWGTPNMEPGIRQRMARHWVFMHEGVPVDYRGLSNPLPIQPAVLDEGGRLYTERCGSCHGASGMGDGDMGKGLSPSPALLAYMIQLPMSVDEYMFWTISEGGESFGTDMPAFKDELEKEQIWTIVRYMRAGFPQALPAE